MSHCVFPGFEHYQQINRISGCASLLLRYLDLLIAKFMEGLNSRYSGFVGTLVCVLCSSRQPNRLTSDSESSIARVKLSKSLRAFVHGSAALATRNKSTECISCLVQSGGVIAGKSSHADFSCRPGFPRLLFFAFFNFVVTMETSSLRIDFSSDNTYLWANVAVEHGRP